MRFSIILAIQFAVLAASMPLSGESNCAVLCGQTSDCCAGSQCKKVYIGQINGGVSVTSFHPAFDSITHRRGRLYTTFCAFHRSELQWVLVLLRCGWWHDTFVLECLLLNKFHCRSSNKDFGIEEHFKTRMVTYSWSTYDYIVCASESFVGYKSLIVHRPCINVPECSRIWLRMTARRWLWTMLRTPWRIKCRSSWELFLFMSVYRSYMSGALLDVILESKFKLLTHISSICPSIWSWELPECSSISVTAILSRCLTSDAVLMLVYSKVWSIVIVTCVSPTHPCRYSSRS